MPAADSQVAALEQHVLGLGHAALPAPAAMVGVHHSRCTGRFGPTPLGLFFLSFRRFSKMQCGEDLVAVAAMHNTWRALVDRDLRDDSLCVDALVWPLFTSLVPWAVWLLYLSLHQSIALSISLSHTLV